MVIAPDTRNTILSYNLYVIYNFNLENFSNYSSGVAQIISQFNLENVQMQLSVSVAPRFYANLTHYYSYNNFIFSEIQNEKKCEILEPIVVNPCGIRV